MKFTRSRPRSRPRSIPPKQTPKHTSEAYPLDKPSSGDTVFPDEYQIISHLVSRFYHRLPRLLFSFSPLLLFSPSPTASSRDQCALLDFNRERQISVGAAGLQPQVPELSGRCRTSARCQRECLIECQNKFAIYHIYFRWYVRNYVRIVFQGGDHLKKVIWTFYQSL